MNKKVIITLSLMLFLNTYAAEVSQQDLQRYSAYYSNGMQHLKNQQYSSAVNEFRKVLRFSPYDETIQDALVTAYHARAEHYRATTKEIKKAINDYKSAYFYGKYWQDRQLSPNILSLVNDAHRELNSLEKRIIATQTPETMLQSAKMLRAQGELAAAAYEFKNLENTKYKEIAQENLGNIYKNLNNLAVAMDYYKKAIDNNPKNPKLHFLYGVMLDEAQNYQASMEQYNLALQYGEKSPELLEILENKWTQNIVNNPQDAQSYINLGAIYQKQGNFDSAKAQYLKATTLDSQDDTALYNLASLYLQQKNYQEAIAIYNKLLEKNQNNIEVLNYKADALKNLNRFDEALKQYESILNIDSTNEEAKSNIEEIVFKYFSGTKLQSYLLSKAQNNPASYEAQFNYALEMHKNKDYNNALQYYKKAQSINPSKEETYINIAQIYIEQKKFKEASTICEKGLLIMPDSNELTKYLNDSKMYLANNQFDEATKLYSQGQYQKALNEYLKIPNQTIEIKTAIASCLWQLKDYKKANTYYQEILAQNPTDEEILFNSAWADYQLNNIENCKKTLNKLFAYNPNHQEAKNLLSAIKEAQENTALQEIITKYENADYNVALNLANKLIQNSNNEYAIYYKGLILDELKKPNEAIKQYKELISKNPEFSSAYYSLAIDLDENKNYKEAAQNYEKFLSLKAKEGSKDEMTEFCQNRLKELKEYLDKVSGNKK